MKISSVMTWEHRANPFLLLQALEVLIRFFSLSSMPAPPFGKISVSL
jgi:hypothetical protein